jgi:hypothetical protein
MASKNLGAVIQRAISDGAFRRQLQSDPAAALRGFNLSPDEIAAVRSGDSSRLLSLGVDSRMSKAFALGAAGGSATRQSITGDLSGTSSGVSIADNTSGAREGLAADQSSGARAAYSDGQNSGAPASGARATISDGQNSGAPASGARATISDGQTGGAVHDRAHSSVTTPQGDAYRAVNDPDASGGARATIGDPTQAGSRSTLTGGQADAYRAVNDPDATGSTRGAIGDPTAGGSRSALTGGQADAYRAVNDPDNAGGTHAAQTTAGDSGPGGANIMADDNYSVASRMHDANVALPGSDVQHDPGFIDSAHSAFIPTDSADVQREALDSQHGTGGDALGHTGDSGDEHSWG